MRAAELPARSRFVFLPLGLCALAAVGAHAAADVAGDRVLWFVDHVDAFFDAIWSRWSFTAPLVDLIGLEQRTTFARLVALLWELTADALVALPLLGYVERLPAEEVQLGKAILVRLRKRPSPMRIVRPLAAACLSLSGAAAVARLAGGSIGLALHAPSLGKLVALIALVGLVVFFAPRAFFRALERGDEKPPRLLRAATLGLVGAALLVPLCFAALAAVSLAGFFR